MEANDGQAIDVVAVEGNPAWEAVKADIATWSIYSRFARSFTDGVTHMPFDLNDDMFDASDLSTGVTFTVTYYDSPDLPGSTWSLAYDNGGPSLATAISVTNNGTGAWLKETVTVYDAVLNNGGPSGEDIALVNTDARNEIFHMIEVEREVAPIFSSAQLFKPDAGVGVLYSDVVTDLVDDPNYGDTVRYNFRDGPAWLSIDSSGVLSGTPADIDVGLNKWTLRAIDAMGNRSLAELTIVVGSSVQQQTLLYDDFENDWGNWLSGGANATLK